MRSINKHKFGSKGSGSNMTASVESDDRTLNGSKVSLREYCDLKMDALEKLFERILVEYKQSVSDALVIRTNETDRRLEILNGEAGRLREMQVTYLLRKEYDIYHEQLLKDVRALENFKIVMDAKASQASVNWSYFFSALAAILAIVALAHELTSNGL